MLVNKVELRRWVLQGLTPSKDKDVKTNFPAGDSLPTAHQDDVPILDVPSTSGQTVQGTPSPKASINPTTPTTNGIDGKMEIDSTPEPSGTGNVISNAKIKCPHGMLDPLKAEHCKRISQVSPFLLGASEASED